MKKEFYHVKELKIYIRLSSIVSYSLVPHINFQGQKEEKCLIVIFSDTIHRCNAEHFYNLRNLLN